MKDYDKAARNSAWYGDKLSIALEADMQKDMAEQPTLLEHSPLGASSAERWLACPASVQLSAGRPDSGSIYAHGGIMAHRLAATQLLGGHTIADSEEAKWMLSLNNDDRVDLGVSIWMYADYINDLLIGVDADDMTKLHVEARVDLAPYHPMLFGTADAIVWQNKTKTLHVVDLKYGKNEIVSVEKNVQLAYYALAAMHTFRYWPKRVVLTIIQPRGTGDLIRSYEMPIAELTQFRKALVAGAIATESQDAVAVVGKWCTWCRAKSVCPAWLVKKPKQSINNVYA